jgi:ribosomal protein S18 acetylase RimI-like enzyme
MVIRDYKESDFHSVISINQESFAQPEPIEFVQASIENGRVWVAVSDEVNVQNPAGVEKVVGFLISKFKHSTSYVNNVAVLSEYRHKGIAKKLFEKFEEFYGSLQTPEVKIFWLQVRANNPAQKLYFDWGYRVTGFDEHYYGRNEHALCMYKSARI